MNKEFILAARAEAQRFIDKCDAAENALQWRKHSAPHAGGYWENSDTTTAALRRSSMDLTRALADLRRPRA